jgi:arylsulfatase A-like enzyme/Flp pilus assembly protein TadD
MKISRRLSAPALVVLLSLLVSGQPAFSSDQKPQLNVLLITIDTWRADRLGRDGGQSLLTPNMDSLAAKGCRFLKAYAHASTTLPSHTSILLGTTPLRHGVHDNVNFIVGPDSLTLAEHLKSSGYATAAFVGAFPLDSRFGLTRGFDVYDDNYGSPTGQEFTYVERKAEQVVQLGLKWLDRQNGPWFLWLHCFDPHQRYDPPEPFKTRYREHPYDGEVAYVDFALGKLFDHLRSKKLMEDTLLILTGDHGESLGEHGESTHGYFAYNATLQVPLVVYFPGIKARRSDQDVCHVDIFPTVCDILGLPLPPALDGLSLAPAVKGRKLPDREIYFESLYPYYSRGWAPLKGIIWGGKKYMDSPIPEFYDLQADGGETKNLAESTDFSRHKEKLARLEQRASSGPASSAKAMLDRQAREKLSSLGYVSSFRGPVRKNFTREDDLKILLPYQTKLMSAMGAYHKGRIEEGISLLQEIIAERKDFDLAYTHLATLYKEKRMWKDALDILRRGYQSNPSNYRIVTTFGIFLAERGSPDEAIAMLKNGLIIIDYDPELWNYLGLAFWKKGAFEEALSAYEKALAIDNNYPIVFNNLGTLYLSQFQKTKLRESYLRAVDYFNKAVALAPDYASPYNGLGTAYAQVSEMEKAVAYWTKAVELKPDFAFPLYNLGTAHLAQGDKARALEYLTRYKEGFYRDLSPQEKQRLDAQIEKCRK